MHRWRQQLDLHQVARHKFLACRPSLLDPVHKQVLHSLASTPAMKPQCQCKPDLRPLLSHSQGHSLRSFHLRKQDRCGPALLPPILHLQLCGKLCRTDYVVTFSQNFLPVINDDSNHRLRLINCSTHVSSV